jgi:hypothetical protein
MKQSLVRNLVGYHNADKMGYSFQDAQQPMTFLTTKSVENLIGVRVWSVAGEGHPREYFLGGWFIVDDVGPSALHLRLPLDGPRGARPSSRW